MLPFSLSLWPPNTNFALYLTSPSLCLRLCFRKWMRPFTFASPRWMAAVTFTSKSEWPHSLPHSTRTSKSECPEWPHSKNYWQFWMSVNGRIAPGLAKVNVQMLCGHSPGHSKMNVRVNVRHSLGLAKVNVHEWPQWLLLAKVNDVNDRIAILLAKVNAETKTDLLNRLRT